MFRARNSGGLSGAIVLIGLVLALAFGGFNLPIFFIALALAMFVGGLGTQNPQRIYGGIIGAVWMVMLALFFITHSWLWFLVGAALSALFGTVLRPIIAGGIFGRSSQPNQPQQQYYQPPSPQQPYEQGYQPRAPQPETYQEGGQQHPYSAQPAQQYDAPQAQYPQQMPPQ